MAQDKTKATVATPSPDYERMEQERKLCRVLMIGTGQANSGDGGFLDNAETYLPQWSAEDDDDYQERRDHLTVVPPFFPDAVSEVTSAILSGPVQFEDSVPTMFTEVYWKDIDRAGRQGDVFLASVGEESTAEGIPHVFVDYWTPAAEEEPSNRTEEMQLGGRPYWVQIHPKDCIETIYSLEASGRVVLQRARWMETKREEDGWGWRSTDCVRVLYRGDPGLARDDENRYARWELYVKTGDEWPEMPADTGFLMPPSNLPDALAREFAEIPLYPFYSGYVRPGVARPPLRQQADLVRLYVLKDSDKNGIEHYANVPREVIAGMTYAQYEDYNRMTGGKIGKGNITFVDGQGTFEIKEHSGAAIGAMRESQAELREEIRLAGKMPLRQRASGKELATLGLMERESKLTRLEVNRLFWEDGFNNCIRRTALLMGEANPESWESTFPEADPSRLFSPELQAESLEKAADREYIDPQTYWEEKQRMGLTSEEFDPKEVAARVMQNRLTI